MSPKTIALPLDIYVRVSDVRGRAGDSFISPKDQEERCRALAKARDYRVGTVLSDLDVSGGAMARPGLDEAIGRIKEGASGGIIVAKLDRFARTLEGALITLREIDEAGGAFVTADGDFDTSTWQGEMVLNILLSIAQGERGRIRDNWQSAKRNAVERGIHISRHVPPGYERGDDRRLLPHPIYADAIRRAFEMAAAGDPYAAIAAHLTMAEVPSGDSRDVQWQSYRIKRLLANRVYLGEARNGHGDVNPAAHEPIVSALTWNLAQRTPSAPGLTQSTETLLAGLCRCASCTFSMRSQAARGSTVAVYRCSTTTSHGRCPAPTTISRTRLEEYVVQQFLERVGHQTFTPVVDHADEIGAAIVEAERQYQIALDGKGLEGIPAADRARYVNGFYNRWQELLKAAPVRVVQRSQFEHVDRVELVERLRREGKTGELRELLASGIAAVFVRPAASRAHNLPISDRVKIVFHGDEALELPRRGERFEPRGYAW